MKNLKMFEEYDSLDKGNFGKSFIDFISENYPMMKNHGGKMDLHQLEVAWRSYVNSNRIFDDIE